MSILFRRHLVLARQAGNALISYMLASALAAGSVVGYRQWESSNQRERVDTNVAVYDKTVRLAVSRYVRENRQAILDAAAYGPVQITIPMLRNTQILPTGWSDRNAFDNVYTAQSYRRVVGQKIFLHTLIVSSGGQAIDEMRLRNIVAKYPDGAGFVSNQSPDTARGANGMWSFPLAEYGLASGGGKLISALFFDEAGQSADYLYRHSVSGKPELNRMNTAVDMGGNDVNNARDVRAGQDVVVGRNVLTADSVIAGGNVAASGSVEARGNVTAGWALRIYQDGAWSGGWSMYDNQWIRSMDDKSIYTGGEVLAGSVSSTKRMRAGEYLQLDASATEGEGCSPNGLVSRTDDGRLLSCQSGVWALNGRSFLERQVWQATENKNYRSGYGDICNGDLWARGWAQQGWVVTGADACSEDGRKCTTDGVLCFAIRLR